MWSMHVRSQLCLTLCDPVDHSPQAPQSMRFSRQEHWSGLPFASPRVFLTQGSNPVSLALAGGLYTTVPPGKLCVYGGIIIIYTQVFNCVEGQCPQTPYCSGVNSTYDAIINHQMLY